MAPRCETRSDRILAAIEREINLRRAILDSDAVLNSVHFLVTMNVQTDGVKKIVFRLEAGHD